MSSVIPSPEPAGLSAPERTLRVCRFAMRFCARRLWAPLQEMPLPNGRRADVLALLPDGGFAIVEVKSCARDFLTDQKWPEYREYCDRLYFAVDLDFPQELIPPEVGLLVVDEEPDAALLREPSEMRPLAPARRRALLHRYATVAAGRLAALGDPAGQVELRAALKVE